MARIFITGTAGFIGFHLAELLLQEGHVVHGLAAVKKHIGLGLRQLTVCAQRLEPGGHLILGNKRAFVGLSHRILDHLRLGFGFFFQSLNGPFCQIGVECG